MTLSSKTALQAISKLSSKSKSKGGHGGGGGNSNAPPPLQALLPPVQPVGNADCRVPVVLVVGGPGVGKTAVAAATLHDAFTYKGMRVLALVPSLADFREALARCGGPPVQDPMPLGCDVVQVAEEVSGGCVCCTVRRDVEDVLADEALAGAPSFDLVVVDTAPASDPMPVIATLFEEHANEVVAPEVSQCFRLDSVVCVVDGRDLNYLGHTVHTARQLAFADVIAVTFAQEPHRTAYEAQGGLSAALAALAREPSPQDVGFGSEGSTPLPLSVSLTAAYPPAEHNRGCLASATSATSPSPLLPTKARELISCVNPLAQIKELPRIFPGEGTDAPEARLRRNAGAFIGGDVIECLCGFNTYCAAAFDRLDLSGLRLPRPRALSPSGVSTTIVLAEGRLMQRRFRDCMSALLRLCKENIFRMRGELCYAETDDARWLFHAVHSVVTISESESRPWAPGEPRVNLLVVTGHDLPIAELHACLRMSLIEEAEKSAEAMAQALLAELEGGNGSSGGGKDKASSSSSSTSGAPLSLTSGNEDDNDASGGSGGGGGKSKKAKKKSKEKAEKALKEAKKKAEAEEKARNEALKKEAEKAAREEALRAKLLEERRARDQEQAAWLEAKEQRERMEAAAQSGGSTATNDSNGAGPKYHASTKQQQQQQKQQQQKQQGKANQSGAPSASTPAAATRIISPEQQAIDREEAEFQAALKASLENCQPPLPQQQPNPQGSPANKPSMASQQQQKAQAGEQKQPQLQPVTRSKTGATAAPPPQQQGKGGKGWPQMPTPGAAASSGAGQGSSSKFFACSRCGKQTPREHGAASAVKGAGPVCRTCSRAQQPKPSQSSPSPGAGAGSSTGGHSPIGPVSFAAIARGEQVPNGAPPPSSSSSSSSPPAPIRPPRPGDGWCNGCVEVDCTCKDSTRSRTQRSVPTAPGNSGSGNGVEAGNSVFNDRSISPSRGSVGLGGAEGDGGNGNGTGDALSPFLSLTQAAASFVPQAPSPPQLPLSIASIGAPPGLSTGFGPPPGLFGSSEPSSSSSPSSSQAVPMGLSSVPLPNQTSPPSSIPPLPPPPPQGSDGASGGGGSSRCQVDDLDLDLMHLAAEAGLGDMLDDEEEDVEQLGASSSTPGSGRGSPDLHRSPLGGGVTGSANNGGGGSRLMGLFGTSTDEPSDGSSLRGFW